MSPRVTPIKIHILFLPSRWGWEVMKSISRMLVRLLGIEGDIYQSLAGVDVPSHLQGLLSPWSRVKLGIFNFVEENTEGLVRTEHLSSY